MTKEESTDLDHYSFLRFVIMATLEVVGMALLIMSGWVFYVGMMSLSLKGEVFSYVAVVCFWSFLLLLIVTAAVIDWVRDKKKERDTSLSSA
jgi:uncharacterized membrane protein